jgi:hypothetical protein
VLLAQNFNEGGEEDEIHSSEGETIWILGL